MRTAYEMVPTNVTIEVYDENILKNICRHTNTARVTMVAIRDNRPSPVPKLLCETRAEKIAFLEGKLRREMRAKQQEERRRLSEEYARTSDDRLDVLMKQENIS